MELRLWKIGKGEGDEVHSSSRDLSAEGWEWLYQAMGLEMRNQEDKSVLPSKHLVPAVLILIKGWKLKNLQASSSFAVTFYFTTFFFLF
jgi:hypothetical protein